MNNLLYYIDPSKQSNKEIGDILKDNSNVKFVSLLAVDLGNNHTDEKIPISEFLKDIDGFLANGIQTDGSSVHLPQIAVINNAKVDLKPDRTVKWYVDYNLDFVDRKNRPIGTLVIPSFLIHNGKYVCSRSILHQTEAYFQAEIKKLLKKYPKLKDELGLTNDVKDVLLTMATELEFWVKTPEHIANIAELSTSQSLKEQYWKRTIGPVRKAVEKSLIAMELYGLKPEMGHKEVGGVHAKLTHTKEFSHIMEQLEIDWQYSSAIQAADNELFVKNLIHDLFMHEGLEVTFDAKPIVGVAGSGEHHHIGASLLTADDKIVNLFAPQAMTEEYLNIIGYGAFMGILGNYESINPFVTSTNDAFKRLKPGFEAPVCIVGSLGHTTEEPSRNRTVLLALVRDIDNPLATRFELRSPNPLSNSYLLTAACYHAMLDGIKYAVQSGKSAKELRFETLKQSGDKSDYLVNERQYVSEEDVFTEYTEEERNKLFSKAPFNVYENIEIFKKAHQARNIFGGSDIFSEQIINSYLYTILEKWNKELAHRLVPNAAEAIGNCVKIGSPYENDLDKKRWAEIEQLKLDLIKDDHEYLSIFSRIKLAREENDYELLSSLQIETQKTVADLLAKYQIYSNNARI